MKHYARLNVLEARDLLLQFHVDLHGAGDGAHRARSHSILARRLKRSFPQLGMRGQAEIIIRGQVNDFLAVECTDGRLLVLKHAQPEVGALGFELVQLIAEVRERIGAGCGGHVVPREILRRG